MTQRDQGLKAKAQIADLGGAGLRWRSAAWMLLLLAALALCSTKSPAWGQITLDGTTNSEISMPNGITTINTKTIVGGSAFNGFEDFNVMSGQTVNMIQPDSADRLINVVRQSVTNIDGTLNFFKDGSIGGNAYIVNPNGLVLGADGVINAGALTITTPTAAFADRLLNPVGIGNVEAAAHAQLLGGTYGLNAGANVTLAGQINANDLTVISGGSIMMPATGQIRLTAASTANMSGVTPASGFRTRGQAVRFHALADIDIDGLIETKLQDVSGDIRITALGDIHLDGLLDTGGDDTRQAGAVMASSQNGDISVTGSLVAKDVVMVAERGDFSLTRPSGVTSLAGQPEEQMRQFFKDVEALFWPEVLPTDMPYTGGTAEGDANKLAHPDFSIEADYGVAINNVVVVPEGSEASIIAANNITISADQLNINGTIRAGRADWNVELASDLDTYIDDNLDNWDTTHLLYDPRRPETNAAGIVSDVAITYNKDTNKIEIAPMVSQGGRVELIGHILSTGKGSIKALSGYGRVNVNSQVSRDLEFQRIETGKLDTNGTQGVVRITDLYRPDATRIGGFVTTEYLRDGDTLVVRDNKTWDFNPNSDLIIDGQAVDLTNVISQTPGARSQSYDPVTGLAYRTVRADEEARQSVYNLRQVYEDSALVGGGLTGPDVTSTVTNLDTLAGYTLGSFVDYVPGEDFADYEYQVYRASYDYTYSDSNIYAVTLDDGPPVIEEVVDRYTLDEVVQRVHTHTLDASQQIAINFTGDDAGDVFIRALGSIKFKDSVVNPAGRTFIEANGHVDTSAFDSILVTADTHVFGQSIGQNSGLNLSTDGRGGVELFAREAIRAREVAGNLRLIDAISGSNYDLDAPLDDTDNHPRYLSGTPGTVHLRAQGSILKEGDQGQIYGGDLYLFSDTGSLGTVDKKLSIDTNFLAANLPGSVTGSANEGIYIEELWGDLWINTLTSTTSGIHLTANDGAILDGNPTPGPNLGRDTAAENALKALLWAIPLSALPSLDKLLFEGRDSVLDTEVYNIEAAGDVVLRASSGIGADADPVTAHVLLPTFIDDIVTQASALERADASLPLPTVTFRQFDDLDIKIARTPDDLPAGSLDAVTQGNDIHIGSEFALDIAKAEAPDDVRIKINGDLTALGQPHFGGPAEPRVVATRIFLESGTQGSIGGLLAPMTFATSAGGTLEARAGKDLYLSSDQSNDVRVSGLYAPGMVSLYTPNAAIADTYNGSTTRIAGGGLDLVGASIGLSTNPLDVSLLRGNAVDPARNDASFEATQGEIHIAAKNSLHGGARPLRLRRFKTPTNGTIQSDANVALVGADSIQFGSTTTNTLKIDINGTLKWGEASGTMIEGGNTKLITTQPIVSTPAQPLTTKIVSLDFDPVARTPLSPDDFYISETDDITIARLSSNVATGSLFDLTAGGAITLPGASSTTDFDINLNANGDITASKNITTSGFFKAKTSGGSIALAELEADTIWLSALDGGITAIALTSETLEFEAKGKVASPNASSPRIEVNTPLIKGRTLDGDVHLSFVGRDAVIDGLTLGGGGRLDLVADRILTLTLGANGTGIQSGTGSVSLSGKNLIADNNIVSQDGDMTLTASGNVIQAAGTHFDAGLGGFTGTISGNLTLATIKSETLKPNGFNLFVSKVVTALNTGANNLISNVAGVQAKLFFGSLDVTPEIGLRTQLADVDLTVTTGDLHLHEVDDLVATQLSAVDGAIDAFVLGDLTVGTIKAGNSVLVSADKDLISDNASIVGSKRISLLSHGGAMRGSTPGSKFTAETSDTTELALFAKKELGYRELTGPVYAAFAVSETSTVELELDGSPINLGLLGVGPNSDFSLVSAHDLTIDKIGGGLFDIADPFQHPRVVLPPRYRQRLANGPQNLLLSSGGTLTLPHVEVASSADLRGQVINATIIERHPQDGLLLNVSNAAGGRADDINLNVTTQGTLTFGRLNTVNGEVRYSGPEWITQSASIGNRLWGYHNDFNFVLEQTFTGLDPATDLQFLTDANGMARFRSHQDGYFETPNAISFIRPNGLIVNFGNGNSSRSLEQLNDENLDTSQTSLPDRLFASYPWYRWLAGPFDLDALCLQLSANALDGVCQLLQAPVRPYYFTAVNQRLRPDSFGF